MQSRDLVPTYADTSDLVKDLACKPDTKLTNGIEEFVK